MPCGNGFTRNEFGTAGFPGIRDILTFIDVQDYNTPPLEGLDGEINQAGSIDYHAAMTELVLQGFRVGGQSLNYPAIPQARVAAILRRRDRCAHCHGQYAVFDSGRKAVGRFLRTT
jgi:hypothetical protein